MMINAFGVSITTFVGQNFGAGKYDRMRRSVRVCLLMTFCATVLMSGFFLLLGGQLYRLFTDDAEVIALGMQILRMLAPTYVTYICIEVLAGAVRGTGDSLIPTLFTLMAWCLLRVVWVMGVAPAYHSLTVGAAQLPHHMDGHVGAVCDLLPQGRVAQAQHRQSEARSVSRAVFTGALPPP